MKVRRCSWLAVVLVAGLAGGTAFADRGHGHVHRHAEVGVIIGTPLFYPWYGPPFHPYPVYPLYPYSYYPPPPPVYVEQRDSTTGQGGYWYRCDNPGGYYPYVKECPAGWRKVLPAPPPD